MRRLFQLLSALALGILLLGACGKASSGNEEKTDILDLLTKEDKVLRDVILKSKAMSTHMKYSVWVPGGYDASKEYPILYLLHGYGGNQNSWLDDGTARTLAKEYLDRGGVPMIIVMPDGQNLFYSGNWETYFYDELMPAVEDKYKCNGKRAIAGLSMGGYGTLYHALKYPSLYTYAYAMSPAAMGDMKALVDAKENKSVFPAFTIEVGNQDTVVSNPTSLELSEYLNASGVSCDFIARDGYHEWGFWKACLPKALEKIGNSFK